VKTVLGWLHLIEVLRHQFDEMLVIEVPGCGDNEISGNKTFLVEIENQGLLKAFHGFLWCPGSAFQRVIFPEIRVKISWTR